MSPCRTSDHCTNPMACKAAGACRLAATQAAPSVAAGALIDAADAFADHWEEGESIPANEVRAALTNAFYAGSRFAVLPLPAVVQAPQDWPTVRAALQAELDHASMNDIRIEAQFGQQRGSPGVHASAIRAVIERFDAGR